MLSYITKKTILFFINAYRYALSPFLPPSCRFTPTCSQYSREAVQRYGAARGLWLSVKRVLKCHPFHPGGYDPVK
jgi:putative membrane protein insertion efficiency factor